MASAGSGWRGARKRSAWPLRLAGSALAGGLALFCVLLLSGSAGPSSAGGFCPAATGAAPTDPPVPPLADFYLTPHPLPDLPSPSPVPTTAGPSIVEVRGEPYNYTYYVNGARELLRGMGYNVAYRFWGWDCDARARRYDRDFAAIKAAGFNTLIGWDEGEFDDLTMAKAQQYGLGVVLPYDFPRDADWENPAVRQLHLQRVEALVRRYAGHPALRMWGLGNEVILQIGDPNNPRALAFSEFF